MDDLLDKLAKREEELLNFLDEREKSIEQIDSRIAKVEEIRAEIRSRIDMTTHLLAERRQSQGTFQQSWRLLSDQPPSTQRLEAVGREVRAVSSLLQRARAHLEMANTLHQATLAQQNRNRLAAEITELQEKIERLGIRRDLATSMQERLADYRKNYVERQLGALLPVVRSFFMQVHANRFLDDIKIGDGENLLRWDATANVDGNPVTFNANKHLSDGQRQDLALAVFLARACTLGGTFFLDEPLVHLDDLNRVAIFDILRMLAITKSNLNLVITTANHAIVRHLREKFACVPKPYGQPLLRIIELDGTPLTGISARPSDRRLT